MVYIKIEDIAEILREFISDRYLVFMGFEEARILGSNIIGFIMDLSDKVSYSAIFFEYIISIDEVYPIAVIIQFAKDIAKNIPLSLVQKVLDRYRGYVYGSGDDMGLLIPIDNEIEIPMIMSIAIPEIMKVLFNYDVRPKIIGYEVVY